jgi:dUTP pyrophosphatase
MEELEVLVASSGGVDLPRYATETSSGMDLVAFVNEPVLLRPFERALIPTGIRISIPEGYEAEIRPRSGLAHKSGVTVLNSPGTIDSDYRGEIKVLLINLGTEAFTVRKGDRVAQMVFRGVARVTWKPVESLADSQRGEGGFGSTGV